jgi:hypothetical protein
VLPYSKTRVLSFYSNPLQLLSGAALLLLSTLRTAYAVTTVAALFFVVFCSLIVLHALKKLLPRGSKKIITVFVQSFFLSVFIFILFESNPFLAQNLILPLAFLPVFCASSSVFNNLTNFSVKDMSLRALTEAVLWSVLLIVMAIVREALGFATVSVPGGAEGITVFFQTENPNPYPPRFFLSSAAVFILFAFLIVAVRFAGLRWYKKNASAKDAESIDASASADDNAQETEASS